MNAKPGNVSIELPLWSVLAMVLMFGVMTWQTLFTYLHGKDHTKEIKALLSEQRAELRQDLRQIESDLKDRSGVQDLKILKIYRDTGIEP